MLTYQDLLACGQEEKERMAFILKAVAAHKSSALYTTAVDAQLYYQGENPTIAKYEKILYDMQGKAQRDLWTANHKISSLFFRLAVDQQVSYLLGNGVSFGRQDTRGRLGRSFDRQLLQCARQALIGGVCFGFWNLKHLELFPVDQFAPLYDEHTGALAAGIRFWRLADKPARYTLFEPGGYTEYIQQKELRPMGPKMDYIRRSAVSLAETRPQAGENYPALPIVPLKNNALCKSELCGRRNTIDALDLVRSNMVNNTDEGNLIYWVLTNCGGMDLRDAEEFLQVVRRSHVAFLDNAADGASAEPRTLEAPFEGTQAAIRMLEQALYQDFMAFDAAAVQAGNQTATAIKASYVPLDLKCDAFEAQVTEFIQGILALAGLEDEPAYTRNKIVNTQEEVQTILAGAEYLDSDYITRKLLTILGDGDLADQVLARKAADDLGRFTEAEQKEDMEDE